jgi:hypothetical protein
MKLKYIFIPAFLLISQLLFSQASGIQNFTPDPAKEKMFLPYLAVHHGGMQAIDTWKQNNTLQYYKELWYYTESFYIKRNHTTSGIVLDESIIDVSRFEQHRKLNQEEIVVLPGFKDALVLLPTSKLLYKP